MDYMEIGLLVVGIMWALVLAAVYLCERFGSRRTVKGSLKYSVLHPGAHLGGLFFGCIGLIIVTSGLAVNIPDLSFIQGADGQVRAVFGKHVGWYAWGLWRWDDSLDDGARIVSYAAEQEAYAMKTNPITENPRVLPVLLSVTIERFGTVDGYLAHHEAIGDTSLSVWVESQMLDFYAAHSKDIAHWQNHHRQDQQEQCREMIRSFLEPQLARIGGRFTGATFRVMTSGL